VFLRARVNGDIERRQPFDADLHPVARHDRADAGRRASIFMSGSSVA
jgi:hypothetical protein